MHAGASGAAGKLHIYNIYVSEKPAMTTADGSATLEATALDARELEAALGLWLRLAQQKDLRNFSRRFAESGVSQLQYAALLTIDANPGCRQSELGAALRIKQPNLVEPLESLAGRGLIARRADPRDRRAQTLDLTAEGRRLLERLRDVHGELIAGYRARLGPEGYEQLLGLLRAFVHGA
jgi:DNA-binding MarR family transcriptional regulator